jgi:hypothetical protein
MDNNRTFGWQPWLLALGLVLSLAIATLFAFRAWQHVPRRQVDEPIHAWMTVPYIARSYRVPPAVLLAALGLPAKPPDRRPIMTIARAQNRPVAAVIADLQNAIVHARPPYVLPSPTPARNTP